MAIKFKVILVMALLVIVTSAAFTGVLYRNQREALLAGIDAKLLTAAHFAEASQPAGYHDAITGPDSVSRADYETIVARYDRLCRELDLQYLWSVLVLGEKIVFTSATSTSKEVAKGDFAPFFDVHTDPAAFAAALASMEVDYSSFHNRWGDGRMVLVPHRDRQGRIYLFGASMGTDDVGAALNRVLMGSVAVGAVVLGLAVLVAFFVAGTLSRLIVQLTRVAKAIASGDPEQTIAVKGATELESLSQSITAMSRSIRETVRELRLKNAELEGFTYTASHDLKSPLISIGGFLGLLRGDIADGKAEAVAADITRVERAAERMSTLLDDLLDLSRIGRIMRPPQPVALGEIVAEAVELTRGRLVQAGAHVAVEGSLPTVSGDPTRLTQVFQNLFDNAAKYAGDAAEPQVHVGAGPDPEAPALVRCFVRDNGVGIAPAYHESVFVMFEKLDPRTPGSGIGLALVKRIVEVHGGRIWIESDGLGHGTTFWLSLPAA